MLNASLILASGVVLLAGRAFIAGRNIEAHRRAMLIASVLAIFFVIFYIIRTVALGSRPFGHEGTLLRTGYLSLLVLHSVVAVVIIPMAIITLRRARRADFVAHRSLAQWTFPLWLFVAVSGWLVWYLLYYVAA